MAYKRTTTFRSGEYVIVTAGDYEQYSILELLLCVQDCSIAKGDDLAKHPGFKVIKYWEVFGAGSYGATYDADEDIADQESAENES